MSELNTSQRNIACHQDGMLVVDAGPGTGKTHTIVERYINIISREDVSPKDVLLLTFTENAAAEMESRIKKKIGQTKGLEEQAKLVQARTFDSFCYSIVMDSPEEAGSLFGIEERLTHGATIVSNDSLNRDYFMTFLDRFLKEEGDAYDDWGIIASQYPESLMKLIGQLMSRGVFPLKKGWFGLDAEGQIYGDPDEIMDLMAAANVPGSKSPSPLVKALKEAWGEADMYCALPPVPGGSTLDDDVVEDAASDRGRRLMMSLVHDVYREFIRRSISDDRLTFGINAMLAFSLLYSVEGVRRRNSYRYLMIDEFQDTNASQLMIALMILAEPNLCVVGDWKQGIYGFRYVSIDNILDFEHRVTSLRGFLNEDSTRVKVQIPRVDKLSLDVNYRSSKAVIDKAFEAMYLEGSAKDPSLDIKLMKDSIVEIQAGLADRFASDTAIRYVDAQQKDMEADAVLAAVLDYVHPGRYMVVNRDTGEKRQMRYGDIAVLCRTTASCRLVLDRLSEAGVPVYFQGDIDIMSTREGKLALAWLRYVNNDKDMWGYMPIMADMGYNLVECLAVKNHPEMVPKDIRLKRDELFRKVRRRVTKLLTEIFEFHRLNNDVTQSIISTLSTVHRGSLVSISDLIRIIEDGIDHQTVYPVENSIDQEAVRVMTMHKSKGLEFPAVIIPFMDKGIMPSSGGRGDPGFIFDEKLGIRCTHEVGRFDGYSKICKSWRTLLVKKCRPTDYNEERRLMFVCLSRAMQYETLISGKTPSRFMTGLMKDADFTQIPDSDISDADHCQDLIERPDLSGYKRQTRRVGIHTLMRFDRDDGKGGMAEADEVCGRGMAYGTKVHQAAHALHEGWGINKEYPELENVRKVLDSIGTDFSQAEVGCVLPLPEADTTLVGVIDLLIVRDGLVEVHDYKTDMGKDFESEYEFQLSVYARAAEKYYGRPAKCFIDYVALGETKEFEPKTTDELCEEVVRRLGTDPGRTS